MKLKHFNNYFYLVMIMFILALPKISGANDKKIALVIGNSNYKNAQKLSNPVNDANDFSEKLKEFGFTVITGLNVEKNEFVKIIENFRNQIHGSSTVIFYYAGHGVQFNNENYFVPVDAKIEEKGSIEEGMIPLSSIQKTIESVDATRILFFDACRNNPFMEKVSRSFGPRGSVVKFGLAPVEANVGTLISFSTQPGNVALDGAGRNSPFTGALLEEMSRRDADIYSILIGVRNRVRNETAGKQIPWEHSSLISKFFFDGRNEPAENRRAEKSQKISVASLSRSAEFNRETRVNIGEFSTSDDSNNDLLFAKNKIERNFVDYFSERGISTSHLISSTPDNNRFDFKINGSLEQGIDLNIEINVIISDSDNRILSSVTIDVPVATFKNHYKSIPHTLLYALKISPISLKKIELNKLPTVSNVAMLYYFEAVRYAGQNNYVKAITLLNQAISEDTRFAMAYWSIGQIYRVIGEENKAKQHEIKADEIDPDHPRRPIISDISNPLPRLQRALQTATWVRFDSGLQMKSVMLESDAIEYFSWKFDESIYTVEVVSSQDEYGFTVDKELRNGDSVLVVNGGFFDIDRQSRLTPSGLLIEKKSILSALAEKRRGSGILYTVNGLIKIVPYDDFVKVDNVDSAIQSGPLIVDPGGVNGIYNNDFDRKNRLAICSHGNSKFSIVFLSGGLSLYELGQLLSTDEGSGGGGCDVAINLDGGPSSQFAFNFGDQHIERRGRWKIQNAIRLSKKEQPQ